MAGDPESGEIQTFTKILNTGNPMRSRRIIALTGAGISAESGLRTFRDGGGLWEGFRVEEVASPQGWKMNPRLVLDFYNQRRQEIRDAKPNAAHLGLARLQERYEVIIITQNIDDLHERAGSNRVIHLHGNILQMRSERDPDRLFPVNGDILHGDRAEDGGQLRPHVVWFGEEVPLYGLAASLMPTADGFILAGSSLNVYPAAGLINLVPETVPKYILDKKIPRMDGVGSLFGFQKPATQGMQELLEILLRVSD